MSKLTSTEIFTLFTAIDAGQAVPVMAAKHVNEVREVTFYRWNGEVYYLEYIFSNTVTEGYQVKGGDLEMFNIYYGKEVVA